MFYKLCERYRAPRARKLNKGKWKEERAPRARKLKKMRRKEKIFILHNQKE